MTIAAKTSAKVAMLLSRRLQHANAQYRDLLPRMTPDEWRPLRGEQEIIATYAPEEAVASLADLLKTPADRARLRDRFERLLGDPRLVAQGITGEQQNMLARIDEVLETKSAARATSRRRPARKTGKGARK